MPTAQTVTLTEKNVGTVRKIKWVTTSTDLGVVISPTTNIYDGVLERVVFKPGAAVAAAYDVTITDADGEVTRWPIAL